MEKNKLNTIKIVVSIALIIFILSKIDLCKMIIELRSVNIIFILLAFLTQLLAIPIRSFMWKTSLLVQKINAPLSLLMTLNLITSFFNNFLPTTMGGDIVKAHKMSKYSGKTIESIASVIVNRLCGFFALITFSVFGVIFGFKLIKETNIASVVFILLFLSIFFILFIFNKKLIEKFKFIKKVTIFFDKKNMLAQFYESFYIYKSDKKNLFFIYMIALLAQFIVLIYYYVIILSLNLNIPFLYLMIVVPLICILEMLPISINGIGIRECAALFFFTKVGVAPHLAVLIGLINFLLRTIVSLIGGIIYIFWRS